jgi:hypothetical protein
MSGAVIPTSILFSSLRTAYNNGGLDDAADDSGLNSGTSNTSLSDFRTAVMADAPPVPAGSAAISIGTVFRGKTFGANNSFSQITNSPFSGTTAPSNITGAVNDEFIFIYSKDSSTDANNDKATITFTNSNSPSARIYSVINIGGDAARPWESTEILAIYTHVPYNTTTASPTYAWNRTSSAAEGIHNSVWDSTCGLGGADGDHNTYSYIKVRIGPAGGAAASGTNTIAMTISSESDYDKLYVYKNAAGGGGGGGSGFTFNFFLTDSFGDGWTDNALFIQQDSDDAYLQITAAGDPAVNSGASADGTGITLNAGSGSANNSAGNISLAAGDYTITVGGGTYASEITWTVKDVEGDAVAFSGATENAAGSFNLTVNGSGVGSET